MIFGVYDPPSDNLRTWTELCKGMIIDVEDWSYEKQFCGVGTFELVVPIDAQSADKLKLNRILMSADGEFIIKQIQYDADNITVTGYDLNGILLDRLTVSKSEDGKDKVSGSTETIVKHFVKVNCVSSDDKGRNFPGLTIETDKERGINNDAASPRLECIADVITNILSAQRMGWRISATNTGGSSSSKLFVFSVYEAVDRTWRQTQKLPITFSYGLGNINSIKTEKSSVELKNTLYCELDDGTVQTYSPDDDNEGFDRTEEYTDLGCELSELEIYAEHEIADRYKPIQNVTLEHVDPSGYSGSGGFEVGDIVTVVDDRTDLKLEALITTIKIKRSGNEVDIAVTIGDTRTKLIDRITKKAEASTAAYKDVSTAIKGGIADGTLIFAGGGSGGASGSSSTSSRDWVGTPGGTGIQVRGIATSTEDMVNTFINGYRGVEYINKRTGKGAELLARSREAGEPTSATLLLSSTHMKITSNQSWDKKFPYKVSIGSQLMEFLDEIHAIGFTCERNLDDFSYLDGATIKLYFGDYDHPIEIFRSSSLTYADTLEIKGIRKIKINGETVVDLDVETK